MKAHRRRSPLRRRASLSYVSDDVVSAEVGPVLPDPRVYLDGARRRLTLGAQRLIAGSRLFHCSVCIAELTYTLGRLDPTHAATPRAHRVLRDILDEIRPYRTLAPSRAAYVEAGIIVGTLVRTQSLGPPDRLALMLDALISS
jgi:hypothetical protein